LGLEIESGEMSIMVKKNTPIPIQKTKIYSTAQDNQKAAAFKVYEGERVMAADNHKLGEFLINDLELRPKGEVAFDVIFRIDENGILNVSARDKKSGNKRDITINSRSLKAEEV
jgi:molecular chaperone DnaK (HSP70)